MEPTQNRRRVDRWNAVPIPDRVAERAYSNHAVDENGCWISTYSVASHGYAQIGWWADGRNRMVLAHRAAWTHRNGQMPLGMTLDHTCKTRTCVNPDHLRMLPNFENARRTSGKDWPLGYCVNGHPNSELVDTSSQVRCRSCRAEYQRRHRQKYPEKEREKSRQARARRKAAAIAADK